MARLTARGIGVLVIPGNHDIDNPWARGFQGEKQVRVPSVSPGEFADLYRDFGYGRAASRDPASLSYSVEGPGRLWFLMLDTNRYEENSRAGRPVTGGRIQTPTLGWIRQRAEARLVVAQHHSLFDHSPVIVAGYTLDNAAEAEAVYRAAGVSVVFSGHIHIQDIVARDGVADIASNALPVYPNQTGWAVFDTAAGTLRYRTLELDVEAWAQSVGRAEAALLSYEAWSARAFGDASRALVSRSLADLDDTQAAQAGATLALVNQRYFAGREGLNTDLEDDPGLSVLLQADAGFLGDYAASIQKDDGTDDYSLELRF